MPRRAELIGYCYDVHGDDLPATLPADHAAIGTTTNLLGIVRTSPPRPKPAVIPSEEPSEESDDPVFLAVWDANVHRDAA